MESLEEDLTCSVCYSMFSDPRVLPCSHTFCKGCLENVLQVSVNFSIWRPLRTPLKCPHCRSMVELPPTGVEALPTNVSLRAIIEKFQRYDQSKSPSCQEHPKQPLNVYCLQDRQLICGVCLTIGQHRGHAIDDLQAAFMKEQEAPGTLVEQLTDKRWAEVSLLAEKLEQQKAGCENLIKQDKESVVLYFEKIKQTLAQKEREFLAALDDAGAKLSSEYDPLLETLKDMKEEQLELMSYSAAVEEEDSPLLFLEKVHIFRERVAALSKAPLPVVKPLYIYPRAGEYLKHKWSGITLGNLEREEIPQINHCQGQVISRNFNRLQALYVSRSVLVFLLLSVLLSSALIGVQLSRYADMYQINEMIQNYACEITAPFYSGKDVAVYFQSVLVDFITVSRSFFQL